MPNDLIVFLVIAGIYLLGWIGKKFFSGTTEGAGTSADPEEERVRKFLEALGQGNKPTNPSSFPPPRSIPPPLAAPPALRRPPPVSQSAPKARPPLPAQSVAVAAPPPVPSIADLDEKVLAALKRMETGIQSSLSEDTAWTPATQKVHGAVSVSNKGIRDLLASPAGIRQVFIAQEIFGKPICDRADS